MATEIRLRASSLPLVAACSAASIAPDVRIVSEHGGSRLGSGVHHFLRSRIGEEEDIATTDELAGIYGVEADDLGPACGQAWNSWVEIANSFPNPETEVALTPAEVIFPATFRTDSTEVIVEQRLVSLTGTADVISRPSLTLARLIDWKSGWADYDHEQQVKGYAFLLARMMPGVEHVEAVVLNTRLGWRTVYRWSVAELEAWWKSLTERLVRHREEYSPSATVCRFCPRSAECPARRQLVRASSEMVALAAESGASLVGTLTPDEAADLLQRARLVEKAAKEAVEIVRAEVAAAGGCLTLSDGRTLVLTEQTKRHIVAAEAWPILKAFLGERMPEAIKVSKTIAEKIVGEFAPPKGKGKAKKAFVQRLEEAGALDTEVVERLEIKRPETEIEDNTVEEPES